MDWLFTLLFYTSDKSYFSDFCLQVTNDDHHSRPSVFFSFFFGSHFGSGRGSCSYLVKGSSLVAVIGFNHSSCEKYLQNHCSHYVLLLLLRIGIGRVTPELVITLLQVPMWAFGVWYLVQGYWTKSKVIMYLALVFQCPLFILFALQYTADLGESLQYASSHSLDLPAQMCIL